MVGGIRCDFHNMKADSFFFHMQCVWESVLYLRVRDSLLRRVLFLVVSVSFGFFIFLLLFIFRNFYLALGIRQQTKISIRCPLALAISSGALAAQSPFIF